MKRTLLIILMAVLAVPVLLPFFWTLSTSLKSLPEVNRFPPEWISPSMSLKPYEEMFFTLPFSTYTLNSLDRRFGRDGLDAAASGALRGSPSRGSSSPGRGAFLLLFLLSQMLPGASVVIPLFQFMSEAGLYDTHIGLILIHTALLLPFVIWLLYGFFTSIPREIEEAALIDGCSRVAALRRVLLPLALPGLGATALFAFLGSWNEFFFALILTNSDSARTIPVGIGMFVGEYVDVLEPDVGGGGPVQFPARWWSSC